jgi:demethylmenaquinone methyltransferase/2-methoxy-6-polyprenyl-1,4-benzoquinol methylase
MGNGKQAVQFSTHENFRENEFQQIWSGDLDLVFADIANYYDTANNVASLGMFGWFRESFLSTIELQPGQKVLDVCAGTNATGIALLEKQPDLEIIAIDRNEEMQAVGRKRAAAKGFQIESIIDDVHRLPFADNHFDFVTIQYASRHLRLLEVFSEIRRVLKPGGFFYHADMLRPRNKLIGKLHYTYLGICLTVTAKLFGSGSAALDCRNYFLDVLSNFYSAHELTELLQHLEFTDVSHKTLLGGLVAFHKARKR